MSSILGIGVSGLHAATTRASVSANNIVNARSEPVKPAGAPSGSGMPSATEFQALKVYQQAVPGGGVQAHTRPVDPPSYQVADPFATDGSGLAYVPNVSLEREFVEQIRAEHAYKASAKIIQTADEMDDTLLDIIR
jgi:flagellar basal body rod protein FlgC